MCLFIDDGRTAGWVLPTLTRSIARDVVAEAHESDLLVVAHAPTVDLAIMAIETGVDGLAHAPIPDGQVDTEEFVSAAEENEIFIISTLVATASAMGLPQIGTLRSSRLWNWVPDKWRKHLGQSGRATPDGSAFERLQTLVASACNRAIPVYPGTDAAFPGVMPGATACMLN